MWLNDVAAAIVCSLQRSVLRQPQGAAVRIVETCNPDVYTLKELVQMAA